MSRRKKIIFGIVMLIIIFGLVYFCNRTPCNSTDNPNVIFSTSNTDNPIKYPSLVTNADKKNKVINVAEDARSGSQIHVDDITILNSNGWITVFLDDAYKYIDTTAYYLSDACNIDTIDLVAHAEPPKFNGLSLSRLIKKINNSCNLDTNTVIYLNGCNTGLVQPKHCGLSIAQILANHVGCIVYGSRGYLTGTFAKQDEKCTINNNNQTDNYPGAINAEKDAVWIKCYPNNNSPNNCESNDVYELDEPNLDIIKSFTIQEIKNNEKVQYSMFPDIVLENKKKQYAFYNNLSYLYDISSKKTYETNMGALKELIDYLK